MTGYKNEPEFRQGNLFMIAAPSGAGKTSLVRRLLDLEPRLRFSISYTTRRQRPSERDGYDYHFVDNECFEKMIAAGEFLEHAKVFDNYYGTSRKSVSDLRARGYHVLLEIDWQGARQVRRALPDSRSIFILPPSRPELERRLRNRATDPTEVIARRLADAVVDLSHWQEFDYVVVNDDFERAVGELQDIVHGGGNASRADRPEIRSLITELLA